VLKSAAYPFNTIKRKDFLVRNFGCHFHFNGKENDNEVKGDGNCIAYEERIYDPRLGRFNSIDPRYRDYAWQSTYAYYMNSPIRLVDVKGAGGPYDPKAEGEEDPVGGTSGTMPEPELSQPKPSVPKPGEIKADQIQKAVTGDNVEARVRGLNGLFKTGDYITSSTILTLTNTSATPTNGEATDKGAIRGLVNDISKIVKTDNGFVVQLKDGKSETSQSFEALKGFSVTVDNNSTVKLDLSDTNKIQINIDGVSVGIFGLPKVTLDDNKVKVLGFTVDLSKKH